MFQTMSRSRCCTGNACAIFLCAWVFLQAPLLLLLADGDVRALPRVSGGPDGVPCHEVISGLGDLQTTGAPVRNRIYRFSRISIDYVNKNHSKNRGLSHVPRYRHRSIVQAPGEVDTSDKMYNL